MAKKRLGDPNEYKGIKQVDGTIDNFSDNVFENGYLYLVRTSQDKKQGYIYLNGKKYGNFQLYDGCIDEEKLRDDAVTENKIKDGSVTEDKLSESVKERLLTDDMFSYLNDMMFDRLQQEAQEKFNGYTLKTDNTTYVYGIQTPSPTQLSVRVGLTFDGTPVFADTTPNAWSILDNEYVRSMITTEDISRIESENFTYTLKSGKYSGHTVTYTSESAEISRLYPVFYGFVPSNDITILSSFVGTLKYSANNVHMQSAQLNNTTNSDGYLCILTKGSATVTQNSVNILTEPQEVPQFYSVYNGAPMNDYRVYYTKNSVSRGSMLGNMVIDIYQ